MASQRKPLPRLPLVTASLDFVDMGDGTTILELTLNRPLAVGWKGGGGGIILATGQIMFTPMVTEDAGAMRRVLEGLPGFPAPAEPAPLPVTYNDVLDQVEADEEEVPF